MSILIYDDNEENLKVMESSLQSLGYDITTSTNVIESISILESNNKDINMVITKNDIDLFSFKDYLYIIRKLNKDIRVVVMTNSDSANDELESIDLCVDDYIKRPVASSVVKKRVENILHEERDNHIIFLKRDLVTIDTLNHDVRKAGEVVELTMKEYKIFVYLMRHCNSTVSREELFESVWHQKFNSYKARAIDVHVHNLRTKLKLLSLYSIRGVGYRIEN